VRHGFCWLLPAFLLMVGCGDLLSLHALYTNTDQVFDPTIEGKWERTSDSISVKRTGDMYELLLQNRPATKEEPTKFELHLVDVQGVRFADLLAADQIGHMILRVRQSGGELHVAFMDSQWLRQQAPHDEADIELGRKQAIFTVPTPQLKKLVAKYALEEKAYDAGIDFSRPK
jgi:hypothetical protein